MDFSYYQEKAQETAIYPREQALVYTALGLVGEAGELANKIKKRIRDGEVDTSMLGDELGDVLWYMAMMATELGLDLDMVAQLNLRKLEDRQERRALRGSGDKR